MKVTSHDDQKLCAKTNRFRKQGGTATAYWLLATTLANHRETGESYPFRVRWISTVLSRNACRRLRTLYALHRVELVCVDPSVGGSKPNTQSSHSGRWSFHLAAISHGSAVVDWLRRSSHLTDFRGRECDVVHSHEWGGVAAPLLMARDDPTVSKVLPEFVVIEPHGSHIWSSMARTHTDLYTLAVDWAERFSMEHADAVVSPTAYMLRYVQGRGWRSRNPSVIPNIVDVGNVSVTALSAHDKPKSKHLIFFSRIEERKGLGVFSDALHTLAKRGEKLDLKIDFVGKFGTINEHPEQGMVNLTDASVYIHEQSGRWPKQWEVRTLSNLTRSEAMKHLKELRLQDAVVVIPSLVENLPYVIAECATLQMRTIAFDTGGIAEMIKPGTGTLIKEKTAKALADQLWKIVGENDMSAAKVPELSEALVTAEKSWISWHRNIWKTNELPLDLAAASGKTVKPFSATQQALALKKMDAELEDYRVATVNPLSFPNMTHMHNVLCDGEGLGVNAITNSDFTGSAAAAPRRLFRRLVKRGSEEADAFLFMTPRYKFIGGKDADLRTLVRSLFAEGNDLVALTAGVRRGNQPQDPSALATGPLYYARMEDERCFHDYPILAKRKAFCDFYKVEKKNASQPEPYWTFKSFIMMIKLEESGSKVGTLPLRMFELTDNTTEPVVDGCFEDSDPVLDLAALKNQSLLTLKSKAVHERYRDHLAPPIVKTIYTWVDTAWSNFTPTQTQPESQGWYYLYRTLEKDGLTKRGEAKELGWWRDDPDRGKDEGTWACPHQTGKQFEAVDKLKVGGMPRMHQLWLVPCAKERPCCGNAPANSVMVRWISNMTIKELNIKGEFELWGSCGDGVRIELRIIRRKLHNVTHAELGRNVTTVDVIDFGREQGTGKVTGNYPNPYRPWYDEKKLGTLNIGDYVEAEFFPKRNQDCDSMYYRIEVKDKQRLGYFSYAA